MSKTAYKRSRPLLGTFFTISLGDIDQYSQPLDALVNEAFAAAVRLEKVFSRFFLESTVSRVNRSPIGSGSRVEPEFELLFNFAMKLAQESQFAFHPFVTADNTIGSCARINEISPAPFPSVNFTRQFKDELDLNGLAKGFIVDCVANWLCERLGETEGSVNAGGDIRFLSDNDNAVSVRVGSSTAPIVRGIKLAKRAFASSSLSASRSGRSTAVYTKKLRKGLSENCVVSTLANNCMTADGLTKIVLFSETSTIEHCCREFEAEALIFGEHGELLEHFGGL